MLVMLFGLGTQALAMPPAPAPLAVTEAESASLAAGEVTFRDGASGERIAVLDIAATPEVVMAAVMDLPPRVADIGALLSIEVYDSGPGTAAARWELGASVYSATFHIRYRYDLAQGWCVYTLDAERDNDIKSSDGSYQVYAHGGGSRLVYRSIQQNSILPAFLMDKFARDGAVELLDGIRRRAGG